MMCDALRYGKPWETFSVPPWRTPTAESLARDLNYAARPHGLVVRIVPKTERPGCELGVYVEMEMGDYGLWHSRVPDGLDPRILARFVVAAANGMGTLETLARESEGSEDETTAYALRELVPAFRRVFQQRS